MRELGNVIYEAMVMCDGDLLSESDLPLRIKAAADAAEETIKRTAQRAAGTAERELIEKALRESGGNITLAAKKLCISRKTLFNKMRALRNENRESD